jgi:hypothetical protein
MVKQVRWLRIVFAYHGLNGQTGLMSLPLLSVSFTVEQLRPFGGLPSAGVFGSNRQA